jgi:NADP-dependent 3-hydroxy acid dehydrogenase YdfG
MSLSPWPAVRTVFLTGASSGIGRATAIRLAHDGHRLALCARRADRLEALAREIPGAAGDRVTVAADVTDPGQVEAAVRAAEARLGLLDTLVYSAGAARFTRVEETTDAIWREMMGANLDGILHTVRALLPGFRRLGRGHVIAVLSVAARHAFPNSSAYTAAKFGALGFLESLRAETRREGIHVTAVLPGATDTPIWDGLGAGWDRGKMMPPEQVARVLASALRDTGAGMIEEIRVLPVEGSL